ncbi:V-set and immunoglobulin domain-containing protein 1-like [Tachysurus vachellii]|uniref:V-set and immunoglobulin domain-containing protein 1-like n=1 Tax=Tachysurus vachellii TaxID=175792 RepID=UPI00296B312B|nr:V-set and immunoglobulin domain-containing protein 1-like [Tachysurus vachellii]
MSPLGTVVVLLGFIGGTVSITVQVSPKVLNVTIGQTASLGCNFVTNQPLNNLMVQWSLYPWRSETPVPVFFYQSGNYVIGQHFQNRLKVLSKMGIDMNASISISNMQTADAGTYTCEVRNLPDIEGTTEANVRVHVFETPSQPFCAVHGDVSTGHLVTLTCHSEKGSPSPAYTWTVLNQGTSKQVKGITNVQTGILYIRNISQFEFGKYQCNASNIVGSSTCTIDLNSDMNDAAIAGAVIGALLCVAFIVLLVWFIAHHLKKKKYNAAKASEPQAAVNYKAVPPQDPVPE